MSVQIKHSNPSAIKGVIEKLKSSTLQEVAVGFPKEKLAEAYPDGTSVLEVAVANNFGTSDIPQRDFMSLAANGIKEKTKPIMREISQLTKDQSIKVNFLYNAAGMVAQEEIRKAIIELDYPPNAPGTLHPSVGGTNPDGKKSTNPLIDTGHMKDSVTFVVRDRTR